MPFTAHHTAVIDEGCQIGEGTQVWHFSHLVTGCRLGDRCNIGQNVYIAGQVVLGNNVKVQNNVSLYDGIICEDDVFIGPSAVFTNVINPRSTVSRKQEYKQTLIHSGATIGANATVLCGVEIGTYAFIGAGAVVTKNVPAYALMMGNPARQKGWMSENGQPLVFDANGIALCSATGEKYSITDMQVKKITIAS